MMSEILIAEPKVIPDYCWWLIELSHHFEIYSLFIFLNDLYFWFVFVIFVIYTQFFVKGKTCKQAGAELGQAQVKLEVEDEF